MRVCSQSQACADERQTQANGGSIDEFGKPADDTKLLSLSRTTKIDTVLSYRPRRHQRSHPRAVQTSGK
eukprot:6198122-Pleurochrysis_carterae.AAC.2